MKKSFVVIATIITAVTLSLSACDSSFENSDSLTQSSDVEDSKKLLNP